MRGIPERSAAISNARRVDDLRRAEAILRDSGDAAGLFVADALRDVLTGRRRADEAIGLACHGGAGGVARVVRRADRDAALRELRRRFFLHLSPREAARQILDLAGRRARQTRLPRGEAEALIDVVMAYGSMPGERQIARVLDIQVPFECPGSRVLDVAC